VERYVRQMLAQFHHRWRYGRWTLPVVFVAASALAILAGADRDRAVVPLAAGLGLAAFHAVVGRWQRRRIRATAAANGWSEGGTGPS